MFKLVAGWLIVGYVFVGTPAAAEGASDGAMNAEAQIDQLLKKHSGSIVQQHLRRLASTDEARKKMRPYDR